MSELDHPSNWKYTSPDVEGSHEVSTPENSACKLTWIYRLYFSEGREYSLMNDELELNAVVIKSSVSIKRGIESIDLDRYDSFYLPAKEGLTIVAEEDCSIFMGDSLDEDRGRFFTRK